MIFLSFSSDDRDAARAIADGLGKAGVPVWCTAVPGTLARGKRPEHEVPAAIARCSSFAVLAVRLEFSDWILDEIAEARERMRADRNFRIVPLLGVGIDPKRLPITIKNFEGLRLPLDPREMRVEHFAALSVDLRDLLPITTAAAQAAERVSADAAPTPTRPRSLLRMVRMPAGKFLMGSACKWEDERPQHRVDVTSFEFASHPVTRGEWLTVMAKEPDGANWQHDRSDDTLPATELSWDEAQAFCSALSTREGFTGAMRYRLPSEAEWEYACRAGTTTEYWSGNEEKDLDRVGWYGCNSKNRLRAVAQKPANPWGLFDMHGNVWEWCEDTWYDGYEGAPQDGRTRVDKASPFGVIRGGSFADTAEFARSAFRLRLHRSERWIGFGFRPARSVATD
jgi:formylglycine-generating enzyme required for sulfatase activity